MIAVNFRNPLNYFCAPNGTGPDYVCEGDFQRFIAFGMLACHEHILGNGTEGIAGDTADVFWLRKNFLDTIENAILALPEMIKQAGDNCEGIVFIPLKEGVEELRFQWRFLRVYLGDDPCLLFTLNWGELDDFAVWLRLDAIDDNALQVLKQAKEWNEANTGETTRHATKE